MEINLFTSSVVLFCRMYLTRYQFESIEYFAQNISPELKFSSVIRNLAS